VKIAQLITTETSDTTLYRTFQAWIRGLAPQLGGVRPRCPIQPDTAHDTTFLVGRPFPEISPKR